MVQHFSDIQINIGSPDKTRHQLDKCKMFQIKKAISMSIIYAVIECLSLIKDTRANRLGLRKILLSKLLLTSRRLFRREKPFALFMKS